MKNIFVLFIIFIFVGIKGLSQKYNPQLLKSYTKKELNNLDKSTLDILDYGIQHAIYYADLPSDKNIQLKVIDETQTINFTDLGLQITNENQYFRISGSNKMLVVKSLYVLNNELINSNKN
jgi:hypothetical protein